jgi:hypothetical protein
VEKFEWHFRAGETLRGTAGSGVKNFDTLWQSRKAGQTAQATDSWQVGRTSKFFRINWYAQSNLCTLKAGDRKVDDCLYAHSNFSIADCVQN